MTTASHRPSTDDDEQRLAELGYKQELHRKWSGFSNFAISFSIISILAGCFTTFGQAWNNGGPVAISLGLAADLALHPDHRLLHVGAGVGVPDRRRHLLVGRQDGQAGPRLVHRLAQPDRPDRGHRVGRLRLRDVPQPHARRCCRRLGRARSTRRSCCSWSSWSLHALINIFGHRHHRRAAERLGVVARVRRGRGRADPGVRAGRSTRACSSSSPSGSTTPASPTAHRRAAVLVLRAAAGLPAHPVHDHRLRRLRARVGGDPGRLARRPPRGCGSRSSTRRSAAGSCCWRSCSRPPTWTRSTRRAASPARSSRPR